MIDNLNCTKAILIVEDDQISQQIINILLKNKYKIHIAAEAQKAKEILASHQIDLILMDISIRGDQHGLSLTTELKTDKRYSHIPIIVVTAHAFADDKRRSFNAGADDYLSKPYTLSELLKTISKYLA